MGIAILGDFFRFCVFSPVFFEFCEALCMRLVVVSIESGMAVDADEGRRPAAAISMIFKLFLLESGVAVGTDEGHHNC
jgi:hypothetical protein